MGENSKIEWTHHTFNPWIGCQKVGPGCDNCYAEAWDRRFATSGHAMRWGATAKRTRTSQKNWNQPKRWNKAAEIQFKAWNSFKQSYQWITDEQLEAKGFIKPTRPRVFCASLADVFDNAIPDEWRHDLFALIAETPYLDWLIVTKRVGNIDKMCQADGLMFDMIGDRVWLGITVCTQAEADRDIPKLLRIPAHLRWLSVEPLLGPVDVRHRLGSCVFTEADPMATGRGIDWIVVGGESGPNARPMHPDWARSLRDQCAADDVPFLFKQWGEWAGHQYPYDGVFHIEYDGKILEGPTSTSWSMKRVGKKRAGRLIDGIEHNSYPA